MRPAILLALSLCAFAQTASQSAEPYHIKNDVLGESIESYQQNNPDCTEKNSITGQPNFYHVKDSTKWSGSCLTMEQFAVISYANRQMKMKDATFFEGQFVRLMYAAEHSHCEFLRDSLIANFGEPTKKLTESIQTKSGAQITGEIVVWDNGVSSIYLEEYSHDLNTSTLAFSLTKYMKQQEEIRKQSVKKAPPDM